MVSRRYRYAVTMTILAALFGCGAPQPPASPAVAATSPAKETAKVGEAPAKFDFDALLKREVAPLPVKKVTGEVLTAEVESSGEPTVKVDSKFVFVQIPIGTEGTLDCYVYNDARDGAGTIGVVVQEMKKTLEIRLFAPTDVAVAGEHAVLMAHAVYLADTKAGKAAGQIKFAFFNDPLAPTLCTHDEAGYSASFKRITKRFFETMQRSDRKLKGKPASSWEVSVTKLDGMAVGFDEQRTYDHPDTRVSTSVTISASLYPRSITECRPQDAVTTRTTDSKGELLELEHITAGTGEIELKVDLKRVSASHYAFTGEQGGKAISGKFQTVDKAGLATDARISDRVKNELLTGKATSFKAEEYVPSIDPTSALEATYEMESKEQRRVRASLGSIRMTSIVDADGRSKSATANVGRATMTVERLASGKR